jgi:hypothetical protein
MSDTEVDKRVVQMDFDNKKFEQNVKQSTESLNDLKKSLNFDGVSDSISQVEVKMSALNVAIASIVVNITNKITQLGLNIIKSLSTDNIIVGWEKYGQKTVAIATMINQQIKIAGKEITGQSEKLSVINDQLESLNWFADETSYSFTDMVSNISKFTATGQDLDSSVKAMEGIATWAALSGQNATTASNAMYQLAQALSKGNVQLIDYKSIQNANMDTDEFRQTILDTAVSLGTLTKSGDEFVTKTGKKFKKSEFTKYLSDDWFSSDVLTKGLEKYSSAVQQIYDIAEKENLTASEVIEKYGDSLDAFGVKAFKAAQEARTFTDVINSIKDAVSSKWLTTAEYIFGSYTEAVKLFTDFANNLYYLFASGGDFRNQILGIWSDLKGKDDLFSHGDSNQGAFWNIYDSIVALVNIIKSSWNAIFPLSQLTSEADRVKDIGQNLKSATERFKNFTASILNSIQKSETLKEIFRGLFSSLKIVIYAIKAVRYAIDPLVVTAKEILSDIFNQLGKVGTKIEKSTSIFSFLQKIAENISDVLQEIVDIINPREVLSGIFSFISKIVKEIQQLDILKKISNYLKDFIKSLKESGGSENNFIKIFNGLYSIFSMLAKLFIYVFKITSKYVLPILESVIDIVSKLLGALSGVIVQVLAIVGDFFTSLNSLMEGKDGFAGYSSEITEFLSGLPKIFKSLEPILRSVIKITKSLIDILLLIPSLLNKLSKALTGKGIVENIVHLFDVIADSVESFKYEMGSVDFVDTTKSLSPLEKFFKGLISLLKGALVLVGSMLGVLGDFLSAIGNAFNVLGKALAEVFDGEHNTILLKIAIAAGVITVIVLAIRSMVYAVQSIISPVGEVADSLSGVLDALSHKLNSQAFSTLASSILEIAASLLIIASINTPDLIKALVTLGIIAAVMIGVLHYTQIISGVTIKATRASKTFGEGIRSLLAEFKAGIRTKNELRKVTTFSGALVAFGTSMMMVAASLFVISKIPWGDLGKGLIVMAGLFVGVIAVSKLAGSSSSSVKKALPGVFQMLSMTLLLKIFADSILKLSSIPWQQIGLSTLSLSIVFLSFGIMARMIGENAKSLSKAYASLAQMIGMAVLIGVFTISLKTLSEIPWNQLLIAIGALSVLFISFGVMTRLMGDTSKKSAKNAKKATDAIKKLGQIVAILLGFAAAVAVLAIAIKILSGLSWQQMLISIATMAIVVGGIVLLSKMVDQTSIDNMLGLSGALALLGLSMLSFAIGLAALGSLPWKTILTGLLTVTAGFIIMGGAAYILQSLTPVIVALASSMFLIGVGLLAASVSMVLFATNISLFVAALTPAISAIASAFETIGPSIVNGLMNSFGAFLDGLITLLPKILTLIENLLTGILKMLSDNTENITKILVDLLDSLLKTLNEHADSIFTSLFGLIKTLLQKLSDNVPDLVDILMTILIKLTDGVTKRIPELVSSVINLLTVLTNAVFGKIYPLTVLVTNDLFEFLSKVTALVTENIIKFVGLTVKLLLILIITTLKMASTLTGTLAQALLDFLGAILKMSVAVFSGMSNVIYETIRAMVANIILIMCKVAENLGSDILKGIKSLASSIWNGMINAFQEMVGGFGLGWLADWFGGLKVSDEKALNDFKEIASGSEVAKAVAEANSNIRETIGSTNDSMNDTLDYGLTQTIKNVGDAIDALNSDNKTITIGVDLDTTNVENKTEELNAILSSIEDPTVTSSGENASAIKSNNSSIQKSKRAQNESSVNNVSTSDSHDVNNYYVDSSKSTDVVLQNLSLRSKMATGG